MKYTLLIVSVLNLALRTTVFGVSDAARQFAEIQAQRDKALAAAAEPINRRYKESLEALLRRATEDQDLETAAKIKEALAIPVETIPDRSETLRLLTGNLWSLDNANKFEFRPNGTFVQLSAGWRGKRWKLARDNRTLEIEFDNGSSEKWSINDGTLRHSSGRAFERVAKPGTRDK